MAMRAPRVGRVRTQENRVDRRGRDEGNSRLGSRVCCASDRQLVTEECR